VYNLSCYGATSFPLIHSSNLTASIIYYGFSTFLLTKLTKCY